MRVLISNIVLILIGSIYGICFTMSDFIETNIQNSFYYTSFADFLKLDNFVLKSLYLKLLFSILLFSILFISIRNFIRYLLSILNIQSLEMQYFKKIDSYLFLPFLLCTTESFGFYIVPLFYILVTFILYIIFILHTIKKNNDNLSSQTAIQHISILFLIAGFSSLIYQVIWQRLLFAAYGGHIESITIIVSIFMLGLGIGSLLGGILSKLFPNSLPFLFLINEIIIGLFGIFSIHLISSFSSYNYSHIIIYILLLIPTICMGSSLPILVEYLNKYFKNIGQSVSILYFVSTLGSAFASFAAVNLIFVYFSLTTACYIAAFFNFLIGSIVYRVIYFHKEKITFVSANDSQNYNNIKHPFITLFIAFISGFIAIGQEITWVRTIGYLAGSESSVFGNALGFFLIGSAFGSLSANKIKSHNYIKIIGYIFLISSILFYFSNPFIAFIATYIGNHSLILAFFLVSINSFLIGSIFPLLCKYAIDKTGSSGLKVSRIYFSNILGSVLGPLIITFYLFDKLPIDSLFLYCTLFGLCITIYLFFLTTHKKDFFIHSSLILFFTFFYYIYT